MSLPAVFLTPPEIQHQSLKRGRGYARAEVDALLERVASSYEEVWLERDALRSRVTQLESKLSSYREAEHLLSETLLSAQRAADDIRSEADKDAERRKQEALAELGSARAEAERELEGIRAEIEYLRGLDRQLRSDLLATLEAFVRRIEAPGAVEPDSGTLVDALSPGTEYVKRDDG
jgi:cell division initiation protein